MSDNEQKYSLTELAAMVSQAQAPSAAPAPAPSAPPVDAAALADYQEFQAFKSARAAAKDAPPPPPAAPSTPHPAPIGSTAPNIPGADPLKWTKSQRDAFLRSKATEPSQLYNYSKNREAWRAAKRVYQEALANVQVLPPFKD